MELQTPATATTAEGEAQARRVPHRWRNLMVLTGVSVVDNTESGLTSTIFPSIAHALKLNSGHLGLLAAIGKIVAVPAGPAWTWLGGRIGRRNTLVLITLVGGVFGALAGFAQNFTELLIFNGLMSAAMVGGVPISNAIIADSFDDVNRGKAVGYFYGFISLISSFVGPLIALFTGLSDGWRYGMWTIGGICVLAGLIVAAFYKDPGVGAAERQLADLSESKRHLSRVTPKSVASIMRIPSFSIMMLSRLLSGHLLINIFGIQFLVTVHHFNNALAATVLVPFGLAYFAGTVGGGWFLKFLDRVWPHQGRVAYIQGAQVFFAVVAFLGTQFNYTTIAVYAVFWALMGFGQGVNPPVNRSIVASVILPELRGQGFAIWLTIFETIGWALFSLGAGTLAESLGLTRVFLWIMVILMLANAAVLTGLYFCYRKDVARVNDTLELRRREALGLG